MTIVSRSVGTRHLTGSARAAGRGAEARPRRTLGRASRSPRRGCGLGAAVELVPDRLSIPLGTPPKSAGRRRGRRVGGGPGIRRPGRGVGGGAQGRQEGVLPVVDGAELPRSSRMRRASPSPCRWGDYAQDGGRRGRTASRCPSGSGSRERRQSSWRSLALREPRVHDVPGSGGLQLHVVEQPVPRQDLEEHIPEGTRSVSVFLVNHRDRSRKTKGSPTSPTRSSPRSRSKAIGRSCPRPDLRVRGRRSGTSRSPTSTTPTRPSTRPATASRPSGRSWTARAACSAPRGFRAPRSRRPRPCRSTGVELSMDSARGARRRRGGEGGAAPARGAVPRLDRTRQQELATLKATRRETAEELLRFAGIAADRIERGIEVLAEDARRAGRLPRRQPRRGACAARSGSKIEAPRVAGLPARLHPAQPAGPRRSGRPGPRDVDLLFFPTGGGKTEAYLGLAAFTMVLRRLRHPADGVLGGAGVSVLMRYTLRLLTLDQLARAAGLVCALELEREEDADALRRLAVRDRPLGRQGRDAEHHGTARATDRSDSARARRCGSSRATRRASRRRSRSRTARGAARASGPTRSRSCPTTTSRRELRIVCVELRVRLHARPPAADRRRRRADLPAAAGLPDRDGRQVRVAAVGRASRERCSAARTATTRQASTAPRSRARARGWQRRCRRRTSSSRTSCT